MTVRAIGGRALKWLVALGALLGGLAGCTSVQYQQQLAGRPDPLGPASRPQPAPPKTIAIFFDGTHNDFGSDTNVKRLHSLVALQDRGDLATLYMEGVGVGSDVICSATGCGVAARVRLAYGFLLTHYRAGDRIALFGFSRGAYQARILASLLNQAGLPDAPPDVAVRRALLGLPPKDQPTVDELVEVLYAEMKAGFHQQVPARTIARARQAGVAAFKPREVELLGLWDTVEALGKPEWMSRVAHTLGMGTHEVVIDELNDRYGDQLLNVRHAVQALSLDDDREWIFTPLLISRCHLFAPKPLAGLEDLEPGFRAVPVARPQICPWRPRHGQTVEEVWFPGAHSDVGGGYADTALPGLSLNWMIGRVREHLPDLLPHRLLPHHGPHHVPHSGPLRVVRQDALGSSHDPEAGYMSLVYHGINRNLAAYAMGFDRAQRRVLPGVEGPAPDPSRAPLDAAHRQLCFHPSVWDRREAMPAKDHENRLLDFAHLRGQASIEVEACQDDGARPPIFRQHDWSPSGGVGAACAKVSHGPMAIQLLTWDEAQGRCLSNAATASAARGVR